MFNRRNITLCVRFLKRQARNLNSAKKRVENRNWQRFSTPFVSFYVIREPHAPLSARAGFSLTPLALLSRYSFLGSTSRHFRPPYPTTRAFFHFLGVRTRRRMVLFFCFYTSETVTASSIYGILWCAVLMIFPGNR